MSVLAPFTITSENLILQTPPPIESDIHIKNLLSDNVTMNYLAAMTKKDQGGWSMENVIERREYQEKQYQQGLSSSCSIYDKNNNFIGICGLRSIDKFNRSGEFGIILDKKFWGKGFSSEAHLLSLTHSFEILGLNRVTFITSSSNEPMIKFFKNVLSSTHEATLRDMLALSYTDETKGYENCELFSILSSEWPTIKNNLENKLNISCKKLNITSNIVENKNKVVLLFGSGRVAKPVMRFFNRGNFHVIVATNDSEQAEELMSCIDNRNNTSYVEYSCPKDNNKLAELFIKSDIIISLLPATMHIELAKQAIISKKNLVTASYVSPAMKELHQEAKSAGVSYILNLLYIYFNFNIFILLMNFLLILFCRLQY
jgi:RimJ/RimL family protein N-acetyltransferase